MPRAGRMTTEKTGVSDLHRLPRNRGTPVVWRGGGHRGASVDLFTSDSARVPLSSLSLFAPRFPTLRHTPVAPSPTSLPVLVRRYPSRALDVVGHPPRGRVLVLVQWALRGTDRVLLEGLRTRPGLRRRESGIILLRHQRHMGWVSRTFAGPPLLLSYPSRWLSGLDYFLFLLAYIQTKNNFPI